jgi:hypothetical protein
MNNPDSDDQYGQDLKRAIVYGPQQSDCGDGWGKASAPQLREIIKRERDNLGKIAGCMGAQRSRLQDIEVYAGTRSHTGASGGDVFSIVDFDHRFDLDARIERALRDGRYDLASNLRRSKQLCAIFLADVAGHLETDLAVGMYLLGAFDVGLEYEITMSGEVTGHLFDKLNTAYTLRMSETLRNGAPKLASFLYGEVHENGCFRMVYAGNPLPLVYSREYGRLMPINEKRFVGFPLLGTAFGEDLVDRPRLPKVLGYHKRYASTAAGDINLMNTGDTMIVFSDGYLERTNPDHDGEYERIQSRMKQWADLPIEELHERLLSDAPRDDDVTLVLVRRR